MNTIIPKVYTPEEVATILSLSKKTVYQLIDKGDIIAKKFGKVYRIPATSISFALTGLDYDLYQAEQFDLANIERIHKAVREARSSSNNKTKN